MMRSATAVLERTVVSPSFSAVAMGKTTDQRQQGGPAMPAPGQEDEAVDGAFDLWLRRGLHQLYDTVAKEPIPEALLRMIEDDQVSKK